MKRIWFSIILLLIVGIAHGQVLYSLNGMSLKGESYLLFVDDMLPTSALIGVKDVFKCYNRSDVVVCEFAENGGWDKWSKLIESPVRLSSLIRYDKIGMVDSVLKADSKLSIGKVEKLKPAAVRMMWKSEICRNLYERGEDDMAMDSYFQQVAIIEGRKILALEDSVKVYDYLLESIDIQAGKMVDEFTLGRAPIVERYNKADSLYRIGDVRGLAELQAEGMTEVEKIAKIEDKVDEWTGKIVNYLTAERCFIILHARYLKGDIIEKLRKKSIKIKEIK